MRIILLMLAGFIFSEQVYAKSNQAVKFPILNGVIEGGVLRIPSFQGVHTNQPEKLFVYADKEYVATLRKKNAFVARNTPEYTTSCDDENTGDYFYDIQSATKKAM